MAGGFLSGLYGVFEALFVMVMSFVIRKQHKDDDDDDPLPPMNPDSIWTQAIQSFGPRGPWYMQNVSERIGPVFRMSISPPGLLYIVVCDGELARRILNDETSTKPHIVYRFFDWIAGGENFFASDGPRSQHVRKSVLPAFSMSRVHGKMKKICETRLDEWIQIFLEPMLNSSSSSNNNSISDPFDVESEILRLTSRNLVESNFDYIPSNDEINSLVEYMECAFEECIVKAVYNPLRRLFWFAYAEARRSKRATKYLQEFSKKILNENRNKRRAETTKSSSSSSSSSSTLLNSLDDDQNYQSDDERIRDMIVLLGGGFDTTAAALFFALFEIAKHPHVQEKLYQEIIAMEDHHHTSSSSSSNAEYPYRTMVLREVYRLHPPLALGSIRAVGRDTPIDAKKVIPKGSLVNFPSFVIHRDPSIFNNPNAFDPERWDDDDDDFSTQNLSSLAQKSLLPFACGRRNCIGQAFATMQIQVILTRLCRDYVWTLETEGIDSFIGVKKKIGTLFRVQKREAKKVQ